MKDQRKVYEMLDRLRDHLNKSFLTPETQEAILRRENARTNPVRLSAVEIDAYIVDWKATANQPH